MADVDQLMNEMGWVRRLARGLLHDADAADDVAQDAFLIARDRAPDRPLRPWLHRVVLNLIRMRVRSETRRGRREIAPDGQAVPTSEQLLERVETQRMLADEVIALREPYRSTIVLRYVEGLSSAEIARRLELSPATVRQRLKHALDELRERIRAREDGPKRGWLAALMPIARTNSHVVMGAFAMKKLITVIAILALLLGGGAWLAIDHHDRDDALRDRGTSGAMSRLTTFTIVTNPHPQNLPIWFAQVGARPMLAEGLASATFALRMPSS